MIRKINDINLRNFNDGLVVSFTGSLTQTKLMSILIPANTFKAGDLITVEALFGKTGTAGTLTHRLYWNSTDSITGAIQLAIRAVTAANRFAFTSRRLSVRTANGGGSAPEVGTELIVTTTGFASEYASSTVSNVALDWTSDSYVMASVQLGNAGDTVFQYTLKIWTH